MGLNIAAKRKMSLKGFAEGWDDCYLIVRAVNERERKEWEQKMIDAKDDADVINALTRQFCEQVVEGGVVINTVDDETTEQYTFTKSEAPQVVESLNFAWQSEANAVATGADRLKAMISSL